MESGVEPLVRFAKRLKPYLDGTSSQVQHTDPTQARSKASTTASRSSNKWPTNSETTNTSSSKSKPHSPDFRDEPKKRTVCVGNQRMPNVRLTCLGITQLAHLYLPSSNSFMLPEKRSFPEGPDSEGCNWKNPDNSCSYVSTSKCSHAADRVMEWAKATFSLRQK